MIFTIARCLKQIFYRHSESHCYNLNYFLKNHTSIENNILYIKYHTYFYLLSKNTTFCNNTLDFHHH